MNLDGSILFRNLRNGKLINADVLVIAWADLNIALPADAFILEAPKGALIVDARNDAERGRAFRTDAEIADVISAFPAGD